MNTIGKELFLSIGNSIQACSGEKHAFFKSGPGTFLYVSGLSHACSGKSMHSVNSGRGIFLYVFGISTCAHTLHYGNAWGWIFLGDFSYSLY